MKVKLSFATQNIKRTNLKNFLKINIDVSEDKRNCTKSNNKPVFLIPVIDCSGSMNSLASNYTDEQSDMGYTSNTTIDSLNGLFNQTYSNATRMVHVPYKRLFSKLDCAKEATVHLLDLLKDGDKVAVVSFDDKIYVNQEPQVIKDSYRSRIKNNIRNIQVGGCTNISGALKTAFDLFSKQDREKYNCKIVLLSDGEANVGYQREEQFIPLMNQIVSAGISTSTIGLGDSYDLGVMETISGNGAGSFNHISNALAIKDIFASELRTTQDIVCKDVTVKLALPDLVAFKPNFNNYNEDIQKDNICIKLGNLYGSKDIYYEFSVLDENAEKVSIAVIVEYEDSAGAKTMATMTKELFIVDGEADAGENEELINELLGIVKDRYVYNATKAATVNDFDGASVCFAESKTTMDSITTAYNCCAMAPSMYDEMEAVSNSITTATSDNLRSTFAKSSKKMRNN